MDVNANLVNFNYSGKENLNVMSLAKNYNNVIFKMICSEITRGDIILDFGAGEGEYCNRLADEYDISAVELDKTFHPYIKINSNKIFTSIDEIKTSYSLIYSINVLEHIQDDNEVISKFHSILSEGGKIKIFIPAKRELFSNMDKKVGHFRRYEKVDLIRLMKKNSFRIKSCKYFDILGYFVTLLYKLLKKDGAISRKVLIFYDKFIFPLSRFFDIVTFNKVIGKNIFLVAEKI